MSLFVLLPTLLSVVYYAFFASDQFESYSVVTIHSAEAAPVLGLAGLIGIPGGGSAHDVLTVREYILSRDMLRRLEDDHAFVAHYQSADWDWWSRLSHDASFEEAFEYYKEKAAANVDSASGTLTLRVRAFDADSARKFSQAILDYSEASVNALTERERRDRTAYAEAEVKRAEGRLGEARKGLLRLQQERSEFNPLASATAAMTIRTTLEADLAKARAELMALKSYMQDGAPKVIEAEQRVRALGAQIANESRKLIDPKKEGGLSGSLVEFEASMVEKEFAEKAYASTLGALELARSDAARQHRYVAVIAQPSKPDDSTYPTRWLGVLSVFGISFLLLGIGALIVAAVREHASL
jgi:capsular polysaccharide transport system permease protein